MPYSLCTLNWERRKFLNNALQLKYDMKDKLEQIYRNKQSLFYILGYDTEIQLLKFAYFISFHIGHQCSALWDKRGQSVCTGILLACSLLVRSVLKETSGDLLACPFRERPWKCHLAGVNYYHGNGHVTWDQWKPRSPKPVAHLFLCHLFYMRLEEPGVGSYEDMSDHLGDRFNERHYSASFSSSVQDKVIIIDKRQN